MKVWGTETQNQKVAVKVLISERMGSIISSFLGGGATAEAAAATSSETSSSRILSFHSPARWQLHFNNSKDSSQLVLLLSFLFNLSLFGYLIHFVGFDWMNELSDGDWFRCVVVWALQVHGARHPRHGLQVHRGRIRKDRRRWITCPYLPPPLFYLLIVSNFVFAIIQCF